MRRVAPRPPTYGLGCKYVNKDTIGYEVGVDISENPHQSFKRPLRDSSDRYLQGVGEIGKSVVCTVLSLPGVVEVWLAPLRIAFKRSGAVDYTDIHPGVLAALKEAYRVSGYEPGEVLVVYEPSGAKELGIPLVESDKPDTLERAHAELFQGYGVHILADESPAEPPVG